MYREGQIEITTTFSEGNTSVYVQDIVELTLGKTTVVYTAPTGTDPQRMALFYDMDLANTTHLDYVFNYRGISNSYRWIKPMTGVPGNAPSVIVNGDDLDTFKIPGTYFRGVSGSDTNVVFHTPDAVHNSTFVLEVLPAGADGQLVQRITRCNKVSQVVCQRMFYVDAWGPWYTISMNNQRVLWEGAHYMIAGQTANLTDKISNMEKGIVLVFSSYTNGAPANSNFQYRPIPKRHIENHPGSGVSIFLNNSDLSKIGSKYLYINDQSIVGHAANDNQGATASGITIDSKYFVLRYVLGE